MRPSGSPKRSRSPKRRSRPAKNVLLKKDFEGTKRVRQNFVKAAQKLSGQWKVISSPGGDISRIYEFHVQVKHTNQGYKNQPGGLKRGGSTMLFKVQLITDRDTKVINTHQLFTLSASGMTPKQFLVASIHIRREHQRKGHGACIFTIMLKVMKKK